MTCTGRVDSPVYHGPTTLTFQFTDFNVLMATYPQDFDPVRPLLGREAAIHSGNPQRSGRRRASSPRPTIEDLLCVTTQGLQGLSVMMSSILRNSRRGFSLVELLCVMAIIAILASLMLPAMGKALRKARGLGGHLGGSGGIRMRIDEVITNYTRYRAANPRHGKLNRQAFVHELQLSANAEAWLSLKSVEYRPFAATDPAKQPAIIVYPSDGSGSGHNLIVFSIEDLIAR